MEIIPESGNDAILMPGVAAGMLGVSTKTLAKMPNLHPIILPSGHRRYSRHEVDALLPTPATPPAPSSATPADGGASPVSEDAA